MPEVLDMNLVENAKNGMMFLPLESDKLKQVYPRNFVMDFLRAPMTGEPLKRYSRKLNPYLTFIPLTSHFEPLSVSSEKP